MPLQVQSSLIGAIVTVAVMTGLLLRRRRRPTDVPFSVLCLSLILWFMATFTAAVTEGDWGIRVELAVAALIPTALIRLFSELLPESAARARRLLSTVYPLSALTAAAALSPLGTTTVVQVLATLFVVVTILWGSRVLIAASDVGRGTVDYARRLYLAIGAAFVAVLCATLELPAFKGSATAIGHMAVMTYVFFLSQVILRDRLLDLNEFLGRMLILGILAILFASVTALLINIGDGPSSRLFNAVFGVIILLTLYEPMKDWLERKAAEVFFRERHGFLQALSDLRQRMQHGVLDPNQMSHIVVEALYDTRRATHAAVYLLDPGGRGFDLHAHRGPEPAPRVDTSDYPELFKLVHEASRPVSLEDLGVGALSSEAVPPRIELASSLRAVNADLLLPFRSGSMVLGFLALRDDRAAEPYATAEIAALETISETAATVVWNSKLAERLRERERLAAIGAMAAGLAHEIRNPLGAIKGAAQYLDPTRPANPEDSEFLEVIIEETNRLNSVVTQFLDYARPFRARFDSVDLNGIIRRTVKLVQARAGNPAPIELELDPALPRIQADGEQLKQVVLNLVLNAQDATGDRESPVVIRTLRRGEDVEVRVRDGGVGIPARDIEQIFTPFFTTKHSGTGLGLAVCQRIVHNHGGSIRPSSTVGRGAEFIVQLPVEAAATSSVARDDAESMEEPRLVASTPPDLESTGT